MSSRRVRAVAGSSGSIAGIEEPEVVARILAHLERTVSEQRE
jgi:hypothetical protein